MYRMPMTVQAKTSARAAADKPKAGTPPRRLQVRRSGVHGRGVFAMVPIEAGTVLIEYKGEVITWDEALRRHPHDPNDPNHTFYFHIDEQHVIDGKVGGNSSRWINHSCEPNCEAEDRDGRIFIKALVDLYPGEELFFDYGLVIDGRLTAKLKKEYECRCGSASCRHTMLAPRRRSPARAGKVPARAVGVDGAEPAAGGHPA
jgi:SET domain-containing protein